MHFGSTRPSAELFAGSLTPSATSGAVSSAQPKLPPSPSPPSACLASLRASTLLDYAFMRQFARARRKPAAQRSLSHMSTSSVYSMRMAQMDLAQQAQRLQRPQLPAAEVEGVAVPSRKADSDIRAAAPTVAKPARERPTPLSSVQRSFTTVRAREAPSAVEEKSARFPTLWRPPEDPSAAIERSLFKLKYRQLEPPCSTATELAAAPARPRPPRWRKHARDVPATLAGSLLSDGLSAFDLRKCHATSRVSALHGFLQDQDMAKLLAETGYTRTELYALWGRFKALCALAASPSGIDKETFGRGVPQLSLEDHVFIDRVFAVLDADGSGILDWHEFVAALSALEKGDAATRVRFLFRVYDLHGDGALIHRDEVRQFVVSSLMVERTHEAIDVAAHFVSKIFDALGCGDRDTMAIELALRYMDEHPSADIYSLFGRAMVVGPLAAVARLVDH